MAKKVDVSDLLRHESGNMFLVFTFPKAGRGKGQLIVPRGQAIEPRKIFSELLNKGAKLRPEDGLEEVKAAIDVAPTKPTGLLVTRRGWHDDIFVTSNGVYGAFDGTVFYRPDIEDDRSIDAAAGTLEAWREGMRDPLASSSYLTLTVSFAFGAPLAELLGVEGGVVCLHGETTCGKTTSTRGGQAVSGRAQLNDITTLAVTPRALEELCACRSNGLVVIDETARLDKGFSKKDFESFVYGVASGRGKGRSAAVSKKGPLVNVKWHVFVMLTSEVSFDPRSLKPGAALRYAEIPVPPPKFGGVFDRTGLKGKARLERASQLAAQVEDTISRNYGVAFEPFIRAIVEDRQMFITRGKELVEEFVVAVGAKGNAQRERLARKFGAAYAGGVIAAELNILPSDKKHISKSIARLYNRSEGLLRGVEEQSPSVLKRIEDDIRAGCFPIVGKGKSLKPNGKRVCGIRRVVDECAVVVFQLKELSRFAGSRGAAGDILDYWAKQGYLLRSADGKNTRQVEVKGWSDKRQRFICLLRSALPTLGKAKARGGK